MLVIQFDHDRVLGVVDIVEDNATVLVEGAGCKNAGDVGAPQPDAVPPAFRGFGVDADAADVRQRKFQLTA